jgi:DNA (cytosine-5)-methyltransferase 1
MGFDAEWGVLSAADVGANHLRERIWIVGKNTEQPRFLSHTEHNGHGWREQQSESVEKKNGAMAYTSSKNVERQCKPLRVQEARNSIGSASWWEVEPNVDRVANGVAARVDRLKAIGNGQVPLCAAKAWNLLRKRIDG